jgi:exodeoxyribonuclease VII large subunit
MQAVLRTKKGDLGEKAAKLDALNPLAVLARGYAAVFGEDGRVVKTTSETKLGDTVTLAMADGKLSATICDIVKNTELAEKE